MAGTEPAERGPQPLHVLYRSYNSVARSRRLGDLLHALVAYMADMVEPDRPDRLLADAGVVVAPDGVVLVPLRVLRWEPSELDAQLRRRGLGLSSVPRARLDVTSGELVVPEPPFAVDRSVLAEAGAPTGGRGWLAPGRHPVLGWVLPSPGLERMSRPVAVAVATRSVANPSTVGAHAMLESLGRTFARVPAVPVAEAWSAAEVGRAVDLALSTNRH